MKNLQKGSQDLLLISEIWPKSYHHHLKTLTTVSLYYGKINDSKNSGRHTHPSIL